MTPTPPGAVSPPYGRARALAVADSAPALFNLLMMPSRHKGLEAAGRLAALSPKTQARMTEWGAADVPEALWTASAFRQICKQGPLA